MERPLSQFMFPTWYRFQITSLLSILHRFTGIALAVGSILFAWWLVAVATGGEVFAATHAFISLRERRRHRNPRFGARQWV
jgi:succinate dehydrogenase / fumarate reductase, cytochrome b subunit